MQFSACRAGAATVLLLGLAAVPVGAGGPTSGQPDRSSDPARFASEVFRLTNAARAKRGLPALRRDVRLDKAAERFSRQMAESGFFSHTGPDGSTLQSRIAAQGYRGMALGENIGMGYTTPQAAVDGWMLSSGHRANILNPHFRDLGVGIAFARGVPYATQVFGTDAPR